MRTVGLGLLVIGLVAGASACSEDRFVRPEPSIKVIALAKEGRAYEKVEANGHAIFLGEVPMYRTIEAVFEVRNEGTGKLVIHSVTYGPLQGGTWMPAVYEPTLPAAEHFELKIPYTPDDLEEHWVKAVISSNDPKSPTVELEVYAQGVFRDAPDIEVKYGDYVGPNVDTDCNDSGVCAIPAESAMSFGNIGLSAQGTAGLILRNTAACDPFPGAAPCTSCAIRVEKNPSKHNVGLGLKEGSNADGLFSFAGSTATPFEILQRDPGVACEETGELRLALAFQAPDIEGEHNTVIVVESNDPDEPVIEIPVTAFVRNAPVAVADFRDYDAVNPSAPWSDPTELVVLSRIYFDGSESYDPQDPTDPTRISNYTWEVIEYPGGANPYDFDYEGQGSKYFSFWAPLAGDYTVNLQVTNVDGMISGNTEFSQVRLHVNPGSRLHVELTWDDFQNDQDLHLTNVNHDDTLCADSDCHFKNCTPNTLGSPPIWFPEDAAHEGANPHLDIDDTNGQGPENINITDPNPGTYRIYVHYYAGGLLPMPTMNTVRVWLNGLQVAEYQRQLPSVDTVWAVADVTWHENGTGVVTPYPSDAFGEVGSLSSMSGCWSSWTFP